MVDDPFDGVRYYISAFSPTSEDKDSDFIKNNLYDLCASIQAAIVSILIEKVKTAVKQTGLKQVVLGGGVSANSGLRKALEACDIALYLPPLPYTTDNAAMIAITGYYKFLKGEFASHDMVPFARMVIK